MRRVWRLWDTSTPRPRDPRRVKQHLPDSRRPTRSLVARGGPASSCCVRPMSTSHATDPDLEDRILDGVATLVSVLDAAGRIVRFNQASETATGLSRADARGRSFASVFPAADDGGATSCTDAAGTRRLIEWTRRPVPPPDGARADVAHVVCTGTDVTDRRAAERAAQDRERLYRNIVETAHEGVWVIDPDGRTLYANRRIAEILGYDHEEMASVNIFDCMDAADHAAFR